MAELIRQTFDAYKYICEDSTDPRTRTWLFVAKPYQAITVLALYLMFVLKWGPQFMKHRQPFNLDKVLIVYNIAQVICCGHLAYLLINEAWGWRYRWLCEPIDYSESAHALRMTKLVYYYYTMKYVDLADTIFFVLRKKFNQISFLHLYHHVSMIILLWTFTTYFAGGHGTLVGLINCCVHCVMYSYYLITVAFPEMKKSIGLKKFVTQVQIIQFFMTIMHTSVIAFKKDCTYPPWTAYLFVPGNVYMLILFVDFYIKNYIKKPKQEINLSKSGLEKDKLPKENLFVNDSNVTNSDEERNKNAKIFATSIQNSKPNAVLRNLKR